MYLIKTGLIDIIIYIKVLIEIFQKHKELKTL